MKRQQELNDCGTTMPLLCLSTVSNPPIVSEEPISAVVNDESARRQNIAARMAKLGGIKLGGPPMFNSRQASESTDKGLQSPTEMPQTPLSPIGDDPLSPTSPAMSRNAGLETTGDDDETDEAAAHRRRATLARLQAGGHLGGFNMFSRNVEPQSPTVEINNMESVPQTPVPRIDERNLQAEEEVVDEYPTGPEVADADVVPDIEDLDEAPPPPPRRPEQLASPPLSPHGEVPVSPLLVRSGTLRSSSSQQSAGTGLPEAPPSAGLAAPIPAGITSMVSEEPQPMSRLETVENEDEVGPPPPPRIDTAGPPAHQRSDSRASRISIGSRHSSQAVPVSPTTPRRTSMQTGRPAYNELQQASSTFGSKVYRAAQKMADTGRRQSIGVSKIDIEKFFKLLTTSHSSSGRLFSCFRMDRVGRGWHRRQQQLRYPDLGAGRPHTEQAIRRHPCRRCNCFA
jgi:hypothetical protein